MGRATESVSSGDGGPGDSSPEKETREAAIGMAREKKDREKLTVALVILLFLVGIFFIGVATGDIDLGVGDGNGAGAAGDGNGDGANGGNGDGNGDGDGDGNGNGDGDGYLGECPCPFCFSFMDYGVYLTGTSCPPAVPAFFSEADSVYCYTMTGIGTTSPYLLRGSLVASLNNCMSGYGWSVQDQLFGTLHTNCEYWFYLYKNGDCGVIVGMIFCPISIATTTTSAAGKVCGDWNYVSARFGEIEALIDVWFP